MDYESRDVGCVVFLNIVYAMAVIPRWIIATIMFVILSVSLVLMGRHLKNKMKTEKPGTRGGTNRPGFGISKPELRRISKGLKPVDVESTVAGADHHCCDDQLRASGDDSDDSSSEIQPVFYDPPEPQQEESGTGWLDGMPSGNLMSHYILRQLSDHNCNVVSVSHYILRHGFMFIPRVPL